MRTAVLLVAAVASGLVVLAAVFVVGMRRKTPLVLNAVRRSGRAMKPLALRSAGRADSPTAVVEHVGRSSGRRYQTPVVAAPVDGGFVIALPYGQNTDWLKNVLSAGQATIRFRGEHHDAFRPEVVSIDDVGDAFADKERRLHRQFRVGEALVMRSMPIAA